MSFYRALLRLYPRSFRAEYGDEMCAVFARDIKATSGFGRLLFLISAALDTVGNAARVHADITRQDVRYAIRSLRRTPGFTITAVVVAALGRGATTATFSVADHLLLRPLPFPESEQLVKLWLTQASRGYSRLEPSPPNYLDWKRLDVLGQTMALDDATSVIVGVVGDLRVRGLERDSEPQVYMPASQQLDGQFGFYAPKDLVIRTSVPASAVISAVRSVINRADAQLPITNVATLEDVVALETAPRVVQLRVLGAFAVAAFLLAAIGIHGLLAFTVSARTREIAVRIALGARAGDILKMVLGRSAVRVDPLAATRAD